VIGPALSIATLVFVSTSAIENLEFGSNSSSATSGGFGPNQVSAVLGLGLLFAVLMLFDRKLSWRLRGVLLALSTVFAVQSALTFSRGGLGLAFAGVVAAMTYLVRNARTRVTLVVLAAVFFGVGNYIVVPQLEVFTKGKIVERYASIDSTGRTELAGMDLQIFQEHPVMGVGPGLASDLRKQLGHSGAAHTEFTRMLAEHGILGLLAALTLVILGFRTFLNARTLQARAFVVAMLLWVTLFLAINAMRLVAPAFLFGLACAISFSSIPIPVASKKRS